MDSEETWNLQHSFYQKECIFLSGLILFSDLSRGLLRRMPMDRIFLETDGADVDIRTIYNKVANDLDMTVDALKILILKNFNKCLIG